MQKLDPKAIWIFFFQFLLIFIFLGFFFGAFLMGLLSSLLPMLLSSGNGEINIVGIILSFTLPLLIFPVLIMGLTYWWAKLNWNNFGYELKDKSIDLQRGVIWKHYSSIPYERIQNVDIFRGIIARILGLSDLQIQTAGYSAVARGFSFSSEGRLPGLNQEVATKIREELLKRVEGSHKEQGL